MLIACSALITDQIKEKCLKHGFNFVTDVPIKPDFITEIYQEVEQMNQLIERNELKRNSLSSCKGSKYQYGLPNEPIKDVDQIYNCRKLSLKKEKIMSVIQE